MIDAKKALTEIKNIIETDKKFIIRII